MAINYLQKLPFLLGVLGDRLHSLELDGETGVLNSFECCALRTVPHLRQLRLKHMPYALELQDFEKGMECLR